MKKGTFKYNLTPEQEKEIITYFETNKNNQIRVIAEKFGLSKHKVSQIIDKKYLK